MDELNQAHEAARSAAEVASHQPERDLTRVEQVEKEGLPGALQAGDREHRRRGFDMP